MKVALYFTLACTAKCAHCITFAAPRVARKMSLDQARRVLRMIRETSDFDGVAFTGGENFLHRDELLDLVNDCTRLGLKSEIISNGYWATTVDAARRTLSPFQEAGLDTLRISVDEYHIPYIPVERVHHALAGMADLGLLRHITCVVPQQNMVYKRSRVQEAITSLGFDVQGWDEAAAECLAIALRATWAPDLRALMDRYRFAPESLFLLDDLLDLKAAGAEPLAEHFAKTKVLVQYQTLATEGRGRELLGDVELKHVDEIADSVCNSVGFSPTVNPEGDVYPCCSSWVNFSRQRLGNVATQPLASLMESMKLDPIVLFMHHQGPRALIKHLRDKGHDLPAEYSHPCHLCGTALERYSRDELLEHIRTLYAEEPWRLLFTTRGFQPEVTASTPFLPLAAPPLEQCMPLAEARRFFGVLDPTGHRCGVRVEGSVGELTQALRARGYTVDLEPIENGPTTPANLGVLRTWGSPWVEILEPNGLGILNDELACDISANLGRRAVSFDYRFDEGSFHHRLFAAGRTLEALDATKDVQGVSVAFGSEREGAPPPPEPREDPAAYVRTFFAELRLREWGISLEQLGRCQVPFPPTLIVESFFLRVA